MPDTIDYSQVGAAESALRIKRSTWASRLIALLAAVAAALWTLGDLDYQIQRVASVEAAARQSLDQQRERATRLASEVAAASSDGGVVPKLGGGKFIGTPTTLIFNLQGQLVASQPGRVSNKVIEDYIAKSTLGSPR